MTPIGIEVDPSVDFSSYGQLAMANTGEPNSSDAQFFVTFGPQPALNQKYTIFGQQVSGFDTLEKLSQVAVSANPATREVPGSGLGLPIVAHVAKRHGGSIRVESEPGRGSTFTLEIPFTEPS